MKNTIASAMLTLGLALAASAEARIVVIANKANPASSTTADQVADYYLGRSNDLTPLDQARDTPIRRDFHQKVSGKKDTQYEAIWAKLEFSGKGTRPRALASDAAVKQAVAADPKAIGYIDDDAVDGSVKVLFTLP